jgi:hypothetical protein
LVSTSVLPWSALCFDFAFAPRFHDFGVPHSSPVLGRVGVLTSCGCSWVPDTSVLRIGVLTYGSTPLSFPGAPLFPDSGKGGRIVRARRTHEPQNSRLRRRNFRTTHERSTNLRAPLPRQQLHQPRHFLRLHSRAIHQHRILRPNQRRSLASPVPLVALQHLFQRPS